MPNHISAYATCQEPSRGGYAALVAHFVLRLKRLCFNIFLHLLHFSIACKEYTYIIRFTIHYARHALLFNLPLVSHSYDKDQVNLAAETCSQSERAAALRWLAEQAEAVQIEAFRLQTDLLRQRRKLGEKVSAELAYACLTLACRKMRHEEEAIRQKDRLTAAEAGNVTRRKIERHKSFRKAKESPKREAIRVKYFHLVQNLRNEGIGWRGCAEYLKKFHRFSINFSYLKATMADLEHLEGLDTESLRTQTESD